ncbi:MAG: hypothetical protein LBD51_01735 [Bifidobacteriaceae bacterium]|jgi:toxin-antitoxin system PIN domain toxin|nr:hypothetical protein [Bifidobacteriaceae bacterium]
MAALLDVSALIALLDPEHSKHREMASWFIRESERGWATCPLTQNGFLRIVTGPRYANPLPPAQAWDALASACDLASHQFWPCDLSLLDRSRFDPGRITGPAQLTDAYLLGLAVERGGSFVTLDRRISPYSVPGAAAEHLATL